MKGEIVNTNNKRILLNTAYLYVQQFLILIVSLFTVRVVLKTLGVEDYGIYNVVGGVVSMLGFIQGMLVGAAQRFFAYELGRKDFIRLNQYFNTTIWCFLFLSIIVIAIAETAGLWFVNTQLVIPENRLEAAQWVYHLSILSFVFQLLMIPYNSIIIAREQMKVYAIVGVVDVVMKLLIVFLLTLFQADKLKLYAVLLCSLSLLYSLFYIFYSMRKFPEAKITGYFSKAMMQEVMQYSGWSLFGSLASVLRSQGINILINMFFSPIVNAARAIAYQVNSVVNMFVNNFSTAFRPQITKQYASGEYESMMILVFRATRLCYYLVLVCFIPIVLEAPYILNVWLGEYPEYTVIFVRLVLLTALIESLSTPLMAAIQATGKIKWYQIIVGSLLILTLPFSYIALKLGYPPQSTMIIAAALSLISQVARVAYMHNLKMMAMKEYLRGPIKTIVSVTLLSIIIPIILNYVMPEGFLRFASVLLSAIISTGASVFYFGITQNERSKVKSLIISYIIKTKSVSN